MNRLIKSCSLLCTGKNCILYGFNHRVRSRIFTVRYNFSTTNTNTPSSITTHNTPITSIITETRHDPSAAAIKNPPPPPIQSPASSQPLHIRLTQYIKSNRRKYRNYLIIAVLVSGCYELIGIYFHAIDTLIELNHPNTIDYSYILGGFSTISIAAIYAISKRLLAITPNSLYKLILNYLKHDIRVQNGLGGGSIHVIHSPTVQTSFNRSLQNETLSSVTTRKTGNIEAFRIVNIIRGGIRWKAEPGVKYIGWERYYRPQKVQFLFEIGSAVSGQKALVIAQAEKKVNGEERINYLAIKLLNNPPGDRIILENDNSEWITINK